MANEVVVWAPQAGPQKALIDCPVYEIFYGGGRGGGKTDGILGKYLLKSKRYGRGFNSVIFRKEMPMLDDMKRRSLEIYGAIGAKYNDSKSFWTFPWGGTVRFRPLECVADADKYQGQNISDVCVEEAGIYNDPAPIKKLHAALRSAHGVPTQLIMTGNPGGAGHAWLKERFINPAPTGFKILTDSMKGLDGQTITRERVFIPALLSDNKILMKNDPNYAASIQMVGSDALVRAWLFGDWSGSFGQFFSEFNPVIHTCKPFAIPDHWDRFCALDWGYAISWACPWFAIDEEGRVYLYQERTGKEMIPKEVGNTIKSASGNHLPIEIVGDTAMWNECDGDSTAAKFQESGLTLTKANKNRVQGWLRVREFLRPWKDGRPRLIIFNNCYDSISCLPKLVHDERNPEDALKDSTCDHLPDAIRYFLMSRPIESEPVKPKPVFQTRTDWVASQAIKDLKRQRRDEF